MIMSRPLHTRGVDSAKVIQVIETQSSRGSEETDQPVRIVDEYWTLEGMKLAESDPYFLGNTDSAFSNVNSAST